ncbi:MAG TPA: PaaI family thioesterase [Caulobacterales bacterium]|jgi:uncharacterized protein (TIGR00369 family)|nr:PaaI family thioesterase [Caulobacterales bacterium]
MIPNAQERLDGFLGSVPYVRFLGVEASLSGDELTARLPYKPELIGNTMIPALHGGALGAFMEMTALAQLALGQPAGALPKVIDVTIEYLRPGRAQATFARADVRKAGRRVANVHVEAWQDARDKPIAFLRGHFLLAANAPSSPE